MKALRAFFPGWASGLPGRYHVHLDLGLPDRGRERVAAFREDVIREMSSVSRLCKASGEDVAAMQALH